jgi:tRNA threonylcarbamoyladenosine modification (KEOPS) complex  Pcc1 subunit
MRAVIEVDREEGLLDLFAAEERSTPRGTYDLLVKEDQVVFTVEAADATALRALVNNILKLLQLWEGAERV